MIMMNHHSGVLMKNFQRNIQLIEGFRKMYNVHIKWLMFDCLEKNLKTTNEKKGSTKEETKNKTNKTREEVRK